MKQEFFKYFAEQLAINRGFINLTDRYEIYDYIGNSSKKSECTPVALINADNLTFDEIEQTSKTFFRHLGELRKIKKIRILQPTGIILYIFWEEPQDIVIDYIKQLSLIDHTSRGGRTVLSWSLSVKELKITKHKNPISLFPPVWIMEKGPLAFSIFSNERDIVVRFFLNYFKDFVQGHHLLLDKKQYKTTSQIAILKNDLKNSIGKGNISIVLEKLRAVIKEESIVYKEILLLQSRLSNNANDYRLFQINKEDFDVINMRITKGTIEIIDSLDIKDVN